MAEVNVTVGGREYRLACRDGDEDDLRAAASLLDARVSNLSENLGSVGEARLLLMAALLVSGELLDRKLGRSAGAPASNGEPNGASDADRAAFEALAARAELLAARLEDAAKAA
jgi:cell division protein ZapA